MLLDLLFPKYCIGCKSLESYLCSECTEKIIRHTQTCIVCKKPSRFGKTHNYCHEYTSIDAAIIATQYKDEIKNMLVKIKYGMHYDLLGELLQKTLVSQRIKEFLQDEKIDLCTEIPMHPYKQNKRGFNVALYIAKWTEKTYNIPRTTLLKKVTQTQAQMQLTRNDRLFNLTNAFQCIQNPEIQNRSIILVDDVTTTGTTLEECATLLKKAGAQKIISLVIAGA